MSGLEALPGAAPERLLAETEAAELLGVESSCLKVWRHRGQGPAYFRLGPRVVRYRLADVRAWLEARRVDQGVGELAARRAELARRRTGGGAA